MHVLCCTVRYCGVVVWMQRAQPPHNTHACTHSCTHDNKAYHDTSPTRSHMYKRAQVHVLHKNTHTTTHALSHVYKRFSLGRDPISHTMTYSAHIPAMHTHASLTGTHVVAPRALPASGTLHARKHMHRYTHDNMTHQNTRPTRRHTHKHVHEHATHMSMHTTTHARTHIYMSRTRTRYARKHDRQPTMVTNPDTRTRENTYAEPQRTHNT